MFRGSESADRSDVPDGRIDPSSAQADTVAASAERNAVNCSALMPLETNNGSLRHSTPRFRRHGVLDRSTDWMRERRVNTVNKVSTDAPVAAIRLSSNTAYPSDAAFSQRHNPHQTASAAGANVHSQFTASRDTSAQITATAMPAADTATDQGTGTQA